MDVSGYFPAWVVVSLKGKARQRGRWGRHMPIVKNSDPARANTSHTLWPLSVKLRYCGPDNLH